MSQRYALDESKLKIVPGNPDNLMAMDPARPPVKPIEFQEYPRVVYKHPKEPFRKAEHRNAQHEVVHTELLQAEALTKVVSNAEELELAMKQGWVKEHYVPPVLPDPNAELYDALPDPAPTPSPKSKK